MSTKLSRMALGALLVLLVVSSAGLSASARYGWVDGTVGEVKIVPGMGFAPNGPLAGARVTVDGSNETNVTDAYGHYNLTLDVGNYTIRFVKGWHEEFNKTNVTVTVLDTTTVNASLIIQYGRINGTIRDEDGPVANVSVSCGGDSALTGPDGSYLMAWVRAGPQTLVVTPLLGSPVSINVSIPVYNATTKDVQLVTPCPVSVRVRDQYENPIAGASVTLGNLSGTTDNDGNVTFKDARPGTFNMTVKAGKYKTYSKAATVDKGGDLFTVTLEKKSEEAAGGGLAGTLLLMVMLLVIVVVVLALVMVVLMRRKTTVVVQAPLPAYQPAAPGYQPAPVQPGPPGAPSMPPAQPPPGQGIPPPPGQ
jgi:hypothetical protein